MKIALKTTKICMVKFVIPTYCGPLVVGVSFHPLGRRRVNAGYNIIFMSTLKHLSLIAQSSESIINQYATTNILASPILVATIFSRNNSSSQPEQNKTMITHRLRSDILGFALQFWRTFSVLINIVTLSNNNHEHKRFCV